MGKTHVVFVGRQPGGYDCWVDAHEQVNKFSCAIHRSYENRDEAVRAFNSYMQKQSSSSTSSASGATCSGSSTQKLNRSGQMVKLNDLVLELEKENCKHASVVARLTKEIKEATESLKLSEED